MTSTATSHRSAPPSLNLGVIGNCAFTALIDERARIVWCCLPRFDGDPVFMAQSAFSLNYTLERAPEIRTTEMRMDELLNRFVIRKQIEQNGSSLRPIPMGVVEEIDAAIADGVAGSGGGADRAIDDHRGFSERPGP